MGNIHIFDDLAENYDTEMRKEVASYTADMIRETIRQLDIKGKTFLDYGCGTGLVGLSLSDLFETSIFIDASPNMAASIQKKINQIGMKNARVICGDAAGSLDPGIQADVLIVVQVLLHEDDVRTLLAKLYDRVSPGGTIIIVDYERNDHVESDRVHPGFELMRLQADLLSAGFEPIYFSPFLHAEKIFMGQNASLFILVGKKQ